MNRHFLVICLLSLLCQCSTKYVPEIIFSDYSGDGSGEVESATTTQIKTTVGILNDENEIDDVTSSTMTSQTDDDIYIITSPDTKDSGITERNDTPTESDEITGNQEAIIVLVVVTCITFLGILLLGAVIIVRKRRMSTTHMTVYPNSKMVFLTSSLTGSKSTDVLDITKSTLDYNE
ncbi:uncharacterized protein LOC132563615 [Ylistrum balloti]|uniref:uncharacterized protein LOC132563615 n=1 Tax=Ylistrum balloti TaxID=509963 RepID=UPI002905DD7E|nr:uncharacterized protein LOC132563615 [Ylistrum balloti]